VVGYSVQRPSSFSPQVDFTPSDEAPVCQVRRKVRWSIVMDGRPGGRGGNTTESEGRLGL